MTFLLTLLMTFIFVLVVILVFIRIGSPVYHLKKHNVETLLAMMVAGQATENDWDVFLGVPIRHNERLEAVRLQCCDINEREFIGGEGLLLTQKGIEEIRLLLAELEGEEE
ncbi:MAG: hypothetical protein EP334_09475 [Gammaproteobacteria bacterium]|nr:MAG: hypothetical protein EP334_09475 [Gammaproteobacteria bacterium]